MTDITNTCTGANRTIAVEDKITQINSLIGSNPINMLIMILQIISGH